MIYALSSLKEHHKYLESQFNYSFGKRILTFVNG